MLVRFAGFWFRKSQKRRPIIAVVVRSDFRQIVEESGQAIEILLCDGIKFVVVAVCAADGQSQKCSAVRLGSLALVVDAQFFNERAAFAAADARAQVGRSDQSVESFPGKHVTGNLFPDELVKRFVLVEGANDVIAVGPNAAEIVEMKSVRIAIAGHVEPVVSTVLPVAWTCQQAVHDFFISIGRCVRHKFFNFFRRRRQSRQVVGNSPDQCAAVRLGRRLQAFFFEPGQHEIIYGVADPRVILYGWNRLALWRKKRPEFLIRRTLFYPFSQERDLFGL